MSLATTIPADGFWAATWPAGTTGSNASVLVPTVSPALTIAWSADDSSLPFRSGTGTVPTGLGVGGGIDVEFVATAVISGSTIAGNAAIGGAGGAGADGGDGLGGGIAIGINAALSPTFPDGSTVQITNSTVALNRAAGGAGGAGANGGDGHGGGLFIFGRPDAVSSATLAGSHVEFNAAAGGRRGTGGADGQGVGGGVYNDGGTFNVDLTTVVQHNHASTSNDDVFP